MSSTVLHAGRDAARSLIRNPGFSGLIVLTLALGLAGGTATFGVLRALLWQALPYHQADRLVVLWTTDGDRGDATRPVAPGDFDAWREQAAETFDGLSAYMFWGFTLTERGAPEALTAAAIGPDLLQTLGVDPLIGRAFTEDEAVVGRGDVVILSHRLWRLRFGGDEGVLGEPILLDDQPHAVVGVMPEGFQFPHENVDLWVPLALNPRGPGYRRPALRVVGRLAEGVTLERSREAMDLVALRLAEQAPESRGLGVEVVPLYEETYGRLEPVLWSAVAAVAAVFLIACANVAHLLLARAAVRGQELAVRQALGASRARLLIQSLLESLLLALAGAAVGLPMAQWALRAVSRLGTGGLPWPTEPTLDAPTLGVAVALAVATSLAFGVLPALRALTAPVRDPLGGSGARSVGGRGRRWTSGLLIALETGFALFLLIGSGLVLLGLHRLEQVPRGFDSEDLTTFRLQLPMSRYPTERRQVDFYEELQDRLAALPGVESAAATNALPLSPTVRDFDLPFSIRGRSEAGASGGAGGGEADDRPQAHIRVVSPDYHRTLGIELRSGRVFDPRDAQRDTRQAIINHAMARQYWPQAEDDPVGSILTLSFRGEQEVEIVGVVDDVRHRGPTSEPAPEIYWPLGQASSPDMALVLRSTLPSARLAGMIERAVWELDPELPVRGVTSMDEIIRQSMSGRRFQGRLLTALGLVALLLSAVGVYGVMSHVVGERRREIALRMALGARAPEVLRGVVGHALAFSLVGLLAGGLTAVAVAVVLARRWPDQLFSVSPAEPLVLLGGAALLLAVAAIGSLVPARRAAAVDPGTILRSQ